MSNVNTGINAFPERDDNLKIEKHHQKQFQESVFQSRTAENVTKEEQTRLELADVRINRVLQSAKKKDTFGARLKEYFRTAVGSSTWLSKQAIPEQGELSQRIDDATTLFQLQSLSDSQKAKRGEKFKKKAERQAEMINLIQKCRWQRKDALQDLLVHGRNARIGTDVAKLSGTTDEAEGHETRFSDTVSAPFLEKVGDDIDDVSPMMRDISFYYEQKRNLSEEKTTPEITSYHYEPLELIANPATRQEGYMRVVDEFEKLDLSVFEYKDNDEFMNNTGNNTFVQRYAQLRAFSHVGKMLPVIGRAAYGDERYFRLYAKAALLEDILTDYKHRTMLIQSPYYVLLGGKNFDSLSKDDLTLRIKRTNDDLAKAYLKSILHQKEKQVFQKGSSVKDLYKEKEKQIEKMVVDRDTEIGKDIDKDIAINVAEALRTKPLVEKYLMFSGNLVSLQRNMESFKFRRDHGLPLKNEYNETLRDEQDLLDSYIAETGEKYDPANVTELDKQKMETWYGKKLGVLKGEFETAEKNILQSFSKCPDILAESKHLLSQFYKVDISKQKDNNTYRLDITGSERRKHLEAYKNKSKIPDDLVDKDVENLINNLVADAIFKKGEVDLSILEPEMIPWFKAYPILKKFTELPTMDSSLAKKQNAADLQNYRDYLKTLPADSEEAEKIRTKIQQLEADADELAIKKELRESMSLRLKNPGNPLLRFYLEKRRLKAINDAKRIILKETDGKYRDAMITRLKILEGDSLLTCEEHKSEFYTPYNSSLKIKMPLTQKQQDMTQAFVASHDRIAELMKIGMQDADTIKEGDSIKKEDRKEVAGLMENARNLIRHYEDPEYERALQLREKQARKKEEERRKQEEKQRKKEEEEAQRKKENE